MTNTDDETNSDRTFNEGDISQGAVFRTTDGLIESVFHVDEERGTVLTVIEQDVDALIDWLNASDVEYAGVNEDLRELDPDEFA